LPRATAGNQISRFEVGAPNGYAAAMSRKSPSDSGRGFNDVIGVALLAAALLLLVAQFSFDRYDLSFFKDPHNKPVHNWIGTVVHFFRLAWWDIFCRCCLRCLAWRIC
jgi:hypothetical protein